MSDTPILDKYLSGGIVDRDELWEEVRALPTNVVMSTMFLRSLFESLKSEFDDETVHE